MVAEVIIDVIDVQRVHCIQPALRGDLKVASAQYCVNSRFIPAMCPFRMGLGVASCMGIGDATMRGTLPALPFQIVLPDDGQEDQHAEGDDECVVDNSLVRLVSTPHGLQVLRAL